MRDVLKIEARKIVVPAWHVRQDTAHFSSPAKKIIDKQKSSYNKSVGAYKLPDSGSPPVQTHCCGFSFALDSSTAGVRPQQCPGLSICSL